MNEEAKAIILSVLWRGIEHCLRLGEQLNICADEQEAAPRSPVEMWRELCAGVVEGDLLPALTAAMAEPNGAAIVESATPADDRAHRLAQVIRIADRLAAAAPTVDTPIVAGLAPVFDQIELNLTHIAAPRRFRWQALTDTSRQPPILPITGADVPRDEARAHLKEFQQRLTDLQSRLTGSSFDCVYTHLLHLLQVYGWCIPADPQATPRDISIYDQTRVTAAIAVCIHQFQAAHGSSTGSQTAPTGQERCLLLTGGISGIQDYLYDISTIGAGGVAKRLRARSFYVQLLTEAACLQVLRAFDLPVTNLLMSAGGRFSLLLPNLSYAAERLQTLLDEFDRWMLRKFHGSLAIKLAWVPLIDEEFQAGLFGKALERVQGALAQQNTQWFKGALQQGGKWLNQVVDADGKVNDAFTGEPYGEKESECKSCHRFPARHHSGTEATENDICRQCHEQLQLGGKLTRANFLSFLPNKEEGINCFDRLGVVLGEQPHLGAEWVLRLNNPDLTAATQFPASFRYFANHIKRRADQAIPWAFEEIAAQREFNEADARRAGLLGILKADVDNLGALMRQGLQKTRSDTLTRLSVFSRELDWFFTGWLESLMKSEFEISYTVYSGGDDLLIVAPRERVLALAERINQQFADYTQNPNITLSAGIAVVKARLPLAHTVEEAERALELAKEQRNRLHILGCTLEWHGLDLLQQEIKQLADQKPTSSLLYQLLRSARDRRAYEHDKQLIALRYHSRLAYQIARNISYKHQRELHDWATRLVTPYPATNETARLWDQLPVITQWVLLERREKSNG
jgi:CRISPR-associated protein Csm1